MDYDITVRVSAEEKVIDIPWEDIEKDYQAFVREKGLPSRQKYFRVAFNVVTSRIRCVFLDRCKKSLIQ